MTSSTVKVTQWFSLRGMSNSLLQSSQTLQCGQNGEFRPSPCDHFLVNPTFASSFPASQSDPEPQSCQTSSAAWISPLPLRLRSWCHPPSPSPPLRKKSNLKKKRIQISRTVVVGYFLGFIYASAMFMKAAYLVQLIHASIDLCWKVFLHHAHKLGCVT